MLNPNRMGGPGSDREVIDDGPAIIKKEGRAHTYCHLGRIGVVVEVNCTTDFCSRTEEFVAWCGDIAMHIAAMGPATVEELLEQPFVKNTEITVAEHVRALQDLVGEPISISRFSRFEVGEL